MEDLQSVAAVIIALACLLVFAVMIWAGQHQS
jgi:TRAP-type C4-dicarboxylate transport system permease small subunit